MKRGSGDLELAAGGTLALTAIAGAALTGAVCPICAVGAPVLLGLGVCRKLSGRKDAGKQPNGVH